MPRSRGQRQWNHRGLEGLATLRLQSPAGLGDESPPALRGRHRGRRRTGSGPGRRGCRRGCVDRRAARSPAGSTGGSHEAVNQVAFQADIQFVHEVNDTSAGVDRLEAQAGISFFPGGFNGSGRLFEVGVQSEQVTQADSIGERFFGPVQFFQEMFFMTVEGRSAGAELLLEDIQRMTSGYQGQVDIMALGMVADGAFHGKTPFSVSGFRFVKSVSAVSDQRSAKRPYRRFPGDR